MAQKETIKNLTASELQKQVKALDKQRDFTITIGEDKYKLKHDIIFRKTKQRELLEDMLKFFTSVSDSNIDDLDMATPYVSLLVIKHFTTLEVPDDITEAISLLKVLIDLDVMAQIMNELPEEQVTKVYELLKSTIDNVKTNIEEVELQAKLLSEQVDNDEVKEMLNNGEQSEV